MTRQMGQTHAIALAYVAGPLCLREMVFPFPASNEIGGPHRLDDELYGGPLMRYVFFCYTMVILS